jgi:hypothetical protein
MFCFQCSAWVTSKTDWERHCQDHLDKLETPLRCDPVTFRYASACAGYCPCCLRDSTLSAAERMRQFPNRALWLQHVQKHPLDIDFSKPVPCPHPLCTEPFLFQSLQDLLEHLQDCHSIPISRSGQKRKFEAEGQSDTQKGKSDIVKRKRPQRQAMPHTAILDPKPDQRGCNEIKSKPSSGTLNYDFVNYSAADLNSSSSDVTRSSTIVSTSSSRDVTRHSTPVSSIDDAGTYRPTNPAVSVDIINEIDPQLLSQPVVSHLRDESPCLSSDSTTFTGPRRPITPAHNIIEHCISLDKEGAHSLEHGSSVEKIDPDQSMLE